eukprot:934219-Amorphochlora_amoeboformis.AAC.1
MAPMDLLHLCIPRQYIAATIVRTPIVRAIGRPSRDGNRPGIPFRAPKVGDQCLLPPLLYGTVGPIPGFRFGCFYLN